APQGRALLINLDFQDFVYSYLWGRALLRACARRQLLTDVVTVHPSSGRDLAGELGMSPSSLVAADAATTCFLERPDESLARALVGKLLERQRYDVLILNCQADLFMHLVIDREQELANTRWLVYDRHLHIDLRAHESNVILRDRMQASGMQLFTLQEIAI